MLKDEHSLDSLISREEREHLLAGIHRYLVWAGEKIPEEVEIEGGKKIKLNDLIWKLIHKKDLTPGEIKCIENLITFLETKKKHDEEILAKVNLTHAEANRLYSEIAGLIRAIMDLKDLERGRKTKYKTHEVKRKIDDAKSWMEFLKSIRYKT